VVGDILPAESASDKLHSLRYLRASHSLIGGVWIRDEAVTIDGSAAASDEEGTPLGDSIYSAFVLQEAARLVDTLSEGRETQKALIMYDAIAFLPHL
jgi:hypothetical protein